MKNGVLVTLFLSAVLALPAFTQQTSSDSSAQAAAATTVPASQNRATGKPPLQPVTSGDFWDGDDPNAVNLVTHPFARKSYVHRQTDPIRDRLKELDELSASNTRMIKDVDTRAQQGIQLVSAKTNEADQHAMAADKVQAAQSSVSQTNAHISKVEQMVGSVDQYKGGEQTEIRFRPGQNALSKDAKAMLDQMATSLKDQGSYIIEIQGFAPGQGHAAIASSKEMANAVVRYLVLSHEIPSYRIYMVGMGNAPVAAEDGTTAKHASGGRVVISLLKNDLLSSAQH
jgi:outer membrane protein OmpA-like peptidoglycan-associated protein